MSHLMPTYSRLDCTPVRGQGVWLYDAQGREYFDGLAGIAVVSCGHNHPRITRAMCEQVATLVHCSNYFQIPLQDEVADKLCEHSGLENAFFCNSGAEANEGALKIARKYGRGKGIELPKVVVLETSFHGRTFATLAATAGAHIHNGFEPLEPWFIRVPAGDTAALEAVAAARDDVSAVLLEPVQGEGGVVALPEQYLRDVRRICDENDWLMMVDEVQCGMCRTGKWFAFQWAGIKPDVMSLAKALGNGIPIGAVVCGERAKDVLKPGNHGTTFGGNPLAVRTAREVISVMEDERLAERADHLGKRLRARLAELMPWPEVVEMRGRGLMLGIVLDRDCHDLLGFGLAEGVTFSVTAGCVVRVVPPLVMTDAECDILAGRLAKAIGKFLGK